MSNLFGLPDVTFAEKDAGRIESDIISEYETLAGVSLSPADPRYKFLQSIALVMVRQRALIDFAGKMNLLAYAKDGYLDHLGVLVGVKRLEAEQAKTSLKFMLTSALPRNFIIPAGTRVSTDDGIVFATAEDLLIAQGDIDGEVLALSEVYGTLCNGYGIGSVKHLMTPIPGVETAVVNTTVTAGGAAAETDDSFRMRIHEAPESYSVAGPAGAYRHFVMSENPGIVDCSVYSPEAGYVTVVPLTAQGAPEQELMEEIRRRLDDDDIRPLTDCVQVREPENVDYRIELEYFMDRADSIQAHSIRNAVEKAVYEYIEWQGSKLGFHIDPSELIKRIKLAGARRVTVFQPEFVQVYKHQYARFSGMPEINVRWELE